ncbi:MAG TPA: family 10 glycosylhydrolase, partial [Bacilli bacterium]|nr:family 10 glycosylhydrolase [Bacilli bacterium]
MKIIKKILVVSLFLGLMLGITTLVKAYDLVPYIDTDGQYLTYTNTFTNVEMPDAYEQQETYFRGIWVTPKDSSSLGNIKIKNNKTKEEMINGYKDEVIQIFDVMDYYNLNALIFHIRIDNDAIYPSTMNPWSDWFTTYGVDPGWDPLEWTIAE